MDSHSAKTISIRQGPNEGPGPTLDVKFIVTLSLGSPGLSPHYPIGGNPPKSGLHRTASLPSGGGSQLTQVP